jgi:hypothetical protein
MIRLDRSGRAFLVPPGERGVEREGWLEPE